MESNVIVVVKPFALKPGATIGVVSPASRPPDENVYQQGISYLKKLGYKVVESEHVLDRRGYLAGTDADRAGDLNNMFRDPAIDAIICSRGGYGAPRIIGQIDFDVIRKNPKIFVGYSDITSLNLAIWKMTGLVTFSGSMVAIEMGSGIEPFTEQYFWQSLASVDPIGTLANPPGAPISVIKPGKSEGRLLGGCLSLINVLLGTRYCPDFAGSILYIEDIGEEPYRVDRYLAQLKLAGIFDQVAGIVIGQFIDCVPDDPEKPVLALDEIFHDYFDSLNIPVVKNFAYGHGPIKYTMPVGVHAILDTDRNGLIIDESSVIPKINV